MTEAEARRLTPGQRVRLVLRDRAYIARVISVCGYNGLAPPRVRIQPDRRLPDGRLDARRTVSHRNLHHLDAHDEATANVFADWLEEAGFWDAAYALRKAFPLSGPA